MTGYLRMDLKNMCFVFRCFIAAVSVFWYLDYANLIFVIIYNQALPRFDIPCVSKIAMTERTDKGF